MPSADTPIIPVPLELDAVLESNQEAAVSHVINMTKGDTRPTLQFHVQDDSGAVVDLTSGTVVFSIFRLDEGTNIVSRAATIIAPATLGTAQWAWQAGDFAAGKMDAEGEYAGKLQVYFSDATRGSVFEPYEVRVIDPY